MIQDIRKNPHSSALPMICLALRVIILPCTFLRLLPGFGVIGLGMILPIVAVAQQVFPDLDKYAGQMVDRTNQFIEDSSLDTATLEAIGLESQIFPDCPVAFSCTELTQQSLESIIRYALSTAPQIAEERARLAVSVAHIEGAQWAFWPTPAFHVLRRSSDDNYGAILSLEQPLWMGGSLSADLDRARARNIVQHSILAIRQLELVLSIVDEYIAWYTADLRRDVWLDTLKIHDGLLTRVKRIHRVGGMSQADVDRAQARRDSVEAEILLSETMRDTALAKLSQLIGAPLDSALMRTNGVATPTLKNAVNPNSIEFQQLIHRQSPYLARTRAEIAVAVANKKRAAASLAPRVFLRMDFESFADAGDSGRIFVGARSDIGSGLSFRATQKSANADLMAAKQAMLAAEREVKRQAASAYTIYHAEEKRQRALRRVVRSTEKHYESSLRLFAGSGKSGIDVMNAAFDVGSHKSTIAETRAGMLSQAWKYWLLTEGFRALD